MRYLSLIKTFLVMKYKVLLEYKAAFWVASFSQILHYSTELLLLWVLVMRFQNLGGWTADEIVLLYSFQLLTYALAGTFFFGCCNSLSDRIQSGQFDEALTLPMPPLLYEVLNHFTTDYIRHFVLALGCFLFAVVRLNLSFNFWKVVLLIVDILGGTLICAAAQLIFSRIDIGPHLLKAERFINVLCSCIRQVGVENDFGIPVSEQPPDQHT